MMKNKLKNTIILLCLILCNTPVHTTRIITFNFAYLPLSQDPEAAQKFAEKLKYPHEITKHQLFHAMTRYTDGIVSGIFCSYSGFLTTSDMTGWVSFPLLHTRNFFYILVTTRIIPILLKGNTVSHWEIEEGTPVSLFKISKEKDRERGTYVWKTEQVDPESTLIDKKQIPIETITIHARPKDIVVPVGTAPMIDSSNIILPTIYVRKNKHAIENALYTFNLNSFFKKVNFATKERPTGYSIHVTYPSILQVQP